MNTIIRNAGFIAIAVVMVFLAYASGLTTQFARAAVAYFNPSTCYTGASSATTSVAYMSPGVGTSTVTCVLGENGAQSAVIAVEVTASSTLTGYTFGVEESMGGIDWFPVRYGYTASTSPNINIGPDGLLTYTFASSTTIGGIGALDGRASTTVSTGNNRNHFTFEIPVRMKRIRVWTGLAQGGANGAVWLQIIPKQNIN